MALFEWLDDELVRLVVRSVPSSASILSFGSTCHRFNTICSDTADAHVWSVHAERLSVSFLCGWQEAPYIDSDVPAEWADPRRTPAWRGQQPHEQFTRLIDYRKRVTAKFEEEADTGACITKPYFCSMLSNNHCTEHAAEAFSDEVMRGALLWYLWDRFERCGPSQCDVNDTLVRGWASVSWGDTVVRDSIFDPVLDALGYGLKAPHDPTRGFGRAYEFFGQAGMLGNEPWRRDPRSSEDECDESLSGSEADGEGEYTDGEAA